MKLVLSEDLQYFTYKKMLLTDGKVEVFKY